MSQSLQKFNTQNQLAQWSRMVEECRNSGMPVRKWCEAHSVPVSTYYTRQRRVFQAVTASAEPQFVELNGPESKSECHAVIARVRTAAFEVSLYAGADIAMAREILEAMYHAE